MGFAERLRKKQFYDPLYKLQDSRCTSRLRADTVAEVEGIGRINDRFWPLVFCSDQPI